MIFFKSREFFIVVQYLSAVIYLGVLFKKHITDREKNIDVDITD
jgi:hypothetical protein